MKIAAKVKQLKIFGIILICILAKSICGKSLNKAKDSIDVSKGERIKRGYSHYGGNDFGSSVQVSSGVLQYSEGDEHSALISDSSSLGEIHTGSHLESLSSNADPWPVAGLSSGYDVWLEPLPNYHTTSALDASTIHTTSIASKHPGSDHITNAFFVEDSLQSDHLKLPSSQLHTQISSSSSSIGSNAIDVRSSSHGHDTLAISDNIDFNNNADANTKHYAKSYGK